MNTKEVFPIVGNVVTYVLSTIQTNEVLQIIEFIMSVVLTIVILVYRIWHWWREAKKDGKITEDEIDQLGEIIEDTKKGKDK